MSLAIWIVLGACAVAVVTDVAARRIPNLLTLALALSAFVLHGIEGYKNGGTVGCLISLGLAIAVFAAVLVLGFVAFSFRWLGGGDVKLLAAGAAALDLHDALPFLLYTAIGGGLLAIVFALVTGRLGSVLGTVTKLLRPLMYKGTVAEAPRKPIMLPYAVAIAFGAGAVALSHTAAPFLRLPL